MIIFIYITHKNICCIAHSILLPKLNRNTSYLLICLQGKGLMHQESNRYFFLGNGLEKECQLATAVEFLTGTGILVIITRSLMSFQLEDFISWFPLNISLWADIESCGICLLPLPDLSSLLPAFLADVQMQGSISLSCQEPHFSHSHLRLCIPLIIICCALSVLCVLWSVWESLRRACNCSSMQAHLLQR